MTEKNRATSAHPVETTSGYAPVNGLQDFARMRAAHVAQNIPGWTAAQLRGLSALTLLIVGDDDFVRLEHAQEIFELIPDAGLAVLPRTTHMDIPNRAELIGPMVEDFLHR